MTVTIPSPDEIIDFPKDNPRLKIVNHKGLLYVVERFYRWSPENKRGVDDRAYVGKIHDGRFCTMEEFKRLFKRDGTPRPIRKSGPVKRRSVTNAAKEAAEKSLETRSEPENKVEEPKPVDSAPSRYEALLAGEVVLIERVARQTGLWKDIAAVWGEQAADAVISLASFFLTTRNNSVYLDEN